MDSWIHGFFEMVLTERLSSKIIHLIFVTGFAKIILNGTYLYFEKYQYEIFKALWLVHARRLQRRQIHSISRLVL